MIVGEWVEKSIFVVVDGKYIICNTIKLYNKDDVEI